MMRRPRPGGRIAPLLAAACLAAVLGGCSSGPSTSLSATPGAGATTSLAPGEEATPQASGSPTSSSPAANLDSPVTGVVLHVDVAGLGRVSAFRLLVPGGQQVDFTMGEQENTAEFPAAHLSEHMASGDPVRVFFRRQGSQLVVYRLEDAAASSPSPVGPSQSPAAS